MIAPARILAATLAPLLVAACLPQTPQPEPEPPCTTGKLPALIGQPAAAADPLPEPKRVYRQGDMVTMDHNPARLNVVLDGAGRIVALKCG